MEGDMAWPLWDGIVRVVNRVIQSPEFSTEIQCMKVACVATGVEGGKQAMKKQVASRKFDPYEANSIVEITQEMHAFVR